MREIILTQGKVALVDDKDYDRVSQFKWYALRDVNCWYAVRGVCVNGKWRTQRMHRFIFNLSGKEMLDHINGNGLDNRQSNLRVCTHSQNAGNAQRFYGKSKYKGVYLDRGRWRANITTNGIAHYLGLHSTQIEAARAYDKAAIKYFGEFAFVNGVA